LNPNYHTPIEDLLVKHLLRETSPEESRAVEEWLAADPTHRNYYRHLQLIWEKSIRLAPGTLQEEPGDEERAWQTFRENLGKPARPKPIISLPRAVAAAAILLPLLYIAFFGWPGARQEQTIVAAASPLTDTLSDGTIVLLNKHSTLITSKKFTRDAVGLKGEAFFLVTHKKDHPFRIAANGVAITVLGTSFNVRTDSARTDVSVETGRVRVANRYGAIEVGPGETITLGPDDRQLQIHASPTPVYQYYHPRIFTCRDTPLEQLTAALQEAYGARIVIADTAKGHLRISTSFRDENLDRILSVLSETLKLTVTYTGDTIIIK
jgi:ferric-dicitrate binding protein FerR (iron transport regulator)